MWRITPIPYCFHFFPWSFRLALFGFISFSPFILRILIQNTVHWTYSTLLHILLYLSPCIRIVWRNSSKPSHLFCNFVSLLKNTCTLTIVACRCYVFAITADTDFFQYFVFSLARMLWIFVYNFMDWIIIKLFFLVCCQKLNP